MKTEEGIVRNEGKTMEWIDMPVEYYDLSFGGRIYVPNFKCGACGLTTESYVRLDEPIMPEDADRPRYCQYCGARATNPGPERPFRF